MSTIRGDAMTWNHRVWRDENSDESSYCIKETYYNRDGEVCSCTEGAVAAHGDTLEELKEVLQRQIDAVNAVIHCRRVALDTKGFQFAKWDEVQ